MADDTDNNVEKKTSKKKKFIIILLALLLLIIVGVGGYMGFAYFTKTGPFTPKVPTAAELQKEAKEREAQMKLAIEDRFIEFDTGFIINIQDDQGKTHIAQMSIVLLVIGPDNEALGKKHMALLASEISRVLSKQQFDELISQTGRQRLKSILLETVRSKMMSIAHKPVVDQVLITNFVMQ